MNELLIVSILLLMGAQFGIALTATVIVHPILVMAKKQLPLKFLNPFLTKHIYGF
jgi:hypothetical protein